MIEISGHRTKEYNDGWKWVGSGWGWMYDWHEENETWNGESEVPTTTVVDGVTYGLIGVVYSDETFSYLDVYTPTEAEHAPQPDDTFRHYETREADYTAIYGKKVTNPTPSDNANNVSHMLNYLKWEL